MKELVWKRQRKNTPGIWAFFFFVVGLALFGGGQLFIEASERARIYSLRMFAIYLFSGLGLMMFISLVGMFRYLKQRGTEMPDSIARAWLAVGTIFASGLVVVVLFLPWPNTGISLASLVPRFQTARRVGESILKERGKAEGAQGSANPPNKARQDKPIKLLNDKEPAAFQAAIKSAINPKASPDPAPAANSPAAKAPSRHPRNLQLLVPSRTNQNQDKARPQPSHSRKTIRLQKLTLRSLRLSKAHQNHQPTNNQTTLRNKTRPSNHKRRPAKLRQTAVNGRKQTRRQPPKSLQRPHQPPRNLLKIPPPQRRPRPQIPRRRNPRPRVIRRHRQAGCRSSWAH